MGVPEQWQIRDFPLGGADLQFRCFLVEMYVKTKELSPIGGCRRRPLDPPMQKLAFLILLISTLSDLYTQIDGYGTTTLILGYNHWSTNLA